MDDLMKKYEKNNIINMIASIERRLCNEAYIFEGSAKNQISEWDNVIKKTLFDLILSREVFALEDFVFKRDYSENEMTNFSCIYKNKLILFGQENKNSINKALEFILKDSIHTEFVYITGGQYLQFYINIKNNYQKIGAMLNLKNINERRQAVQILNNILESQFSF